MSTLKTVYLEPHLDARIGTEAARKKLSKPEQFRRYLRAGIRAVKAQQALGQPAPWRHGEPPLLLRHVELDASLDWWLRAQAFDAGVSQSDYLRWCVNLGSQRTAN